MVLFLIVYFIKRIRWTVKRILAIFIVLIAGQRLFPIIWQWFVRKFISGWLGTYNYYATKGGVLADALLFVYIITCLVAIMKLSLSKHKGYRVLSGYIVEKKKKRGKKSLEEYIPYDSLFNLYLGMSILAAVLIVFTSIEAP